MSIGTNSKNHLLKEGLCDLPFSITAADVPFFQRKRIEASVRYSPKTKSEKEDKFKYRYSKLLLPTIGIAYLLQFVLKLSHDHQPTVSF